MQHRITDFLAYRWRYILGYTIALSAVAVMLTVAALFVPHELRQGELDSAVTSGSLGTTTMVPNAVVNLPYHLLQKFSFVLFGVSTLTIKLPSILLGALTALGVFLLLKTWFHTRVAILGVALTIITSQFLFLSQDGTPLVVFPFVATWLLFVATYVTRRKIFGLLWKVLTCLAMAMSLYTPLGIYLVLVMLVVALFHPHIRYLIRRFNPYKLLIAVLLSLGAVVPLIYAIYLDHTILTTLLGIPTNGLNLPENFILVVKETFGIASLSSSYLIRPLYPLGAAILMFVGLYHLLTKKHTARSTITLAWGVVLSVLVILNPDYVTYLYPISVILVAYGITYMFSSWYRLFPHNPYARVAGFIPLAILIVAMISSGVSRYVNTYLYNPAILANYTSDLRLLRTTLQTEKAGNHGATLIVDQNNLAFYRLVSKYDQRIDVTADPSATGKLVLASRSMKKAGVEPHVIVVNARANDADRFYVYKTAPQ